MPLSAGDQVTHPTRPQWGTGTVRQCQPIKHDGQSAWRVTVDFARRGRVVINTAIVELTPKNNRNGASDTTGLESGQAQERDLPMTRVSSAASSNADKGWLDSLEKKVYGSSNELWSLPGELSDPFLSEMQRLDATLATYQYSPEPKALIDWAVAQTGLDDPLTQFNRVELEQAFPRFARDRDQHLVDLVRQMKRNGHETAIRQKMQTLRHRPAREALKKALRA